MHKDISGVPEKNVTKHSIHAHLAKTDISMARVSEDAILALLRGGLIKPRDLPDKAREVLEIRAELRELLEKCRKKESRGNVKIAG